MFLVKRVWQDCYKCLCSFSLFLLVVWGFFLPCFCLLHHCFLLAPDEGGSSRLELVNLCFPPKKSHHRNLLKQKKIRVRKKKKSVCSSWNEGSWTELLLTFVVEQEWLVITLSSAQGFSPACYHFKLYTFFHLPIVTLSFTLSFTCLFHFKFTLLFTCLLSL